MRSVHAIEEGGRTWCGRQWVHYEDDGSVVVRLDAVTESDYRGMEWKRLRPCGTCGFAMDRAASLRSPSSPEVGR